MGAERERAQERKRQGRGVTSTNKKKTYETKLKGINDVHRRTPRATRVRADLQRLKALAVTMATLTLSCSSLFRRLSVSQSGTRRCMDMHKPTPERERVQEKKERRRQQEPQQTNAERERERVRVNRPQNQRWKENTRTPTHRQAHAERSTNQAMKDKEQERVREEGSPETCREGLRVGRRDWLK